MAGGSKTTKQTVDRSPWYQQAGQDALSRAQTLSNRPYEGFTGERVAGLSGNEQQASSLASTMGNQTQPFMQRLQRGFTPGALEQFTNPYTDSVLGARKRSIGEEYGRQSAGLARNQAASDAFRTGRSDLARSRLDANRMRALDEATNQTKSEAYDKGLAAYFNQNQSDLGALNGVTAQAATQIGALQNTGASERSIRQAQDDFTYGSFLEKRDWDVNNLNNLLNAIQAVEPTAGTTKKTTTPKKGMMGSILGIAGTAVGFMFGGPAGAALGGSLGGSVGGMIDG